MAALKALTSGGVTVLNSAVGSDLGFQRGNVVHRGCDFQIQMKSGRRLNMAKAAETSSYSYVNGHDEDSVFVNGSVAGFPNGHGKTVHQMSAIEKSSNIVWHECSIRKRDREELLQQKGCVIWITGLSGSGKSTLANALSRSLHSRGRLTYVLDGDNVRHGLNRDLTFGEEDRVENIRRVGEVAKLFADAGIICIVSLISPYRKDREACRAMLPKGDFIEVFMDVPLQLCEARDPKGLYKLARAGKIKGFTGIDDPYENPINSEAVDDGETKFFSPLERREAGNEAHGHVSGTRAYSVKDSSKPPLLQSPECAYAIPHLSYNGGQQHGGFNVLKKMRKTEGKSPGEDEKPAHGV